MAQRSLVWGPALILGVGVIGGIFWMRSGLDKYDIRAMEVQERGRYGVATLHDVEVRNQSSGDTPSAVYLVRYSFRDGDQLVRGTGAADASDQGREGDVVLVAWPPGAPDLALLHRHWRLADLDRAAGTVTAVSRTVVPRGDLYAVEREDAVLHYDYTVGETTYGGIEVVGPAHDDAVGKQFLVLYRRNQPDEAVLLHHVPVEGPDLPAFP